jgi:hypothetical protein
MPFEAARGLIKEAATRDELLMAVRRSERKRSHPDRPLGDSIVMQKESTAPSFHRCYLQFIPALKAAPKSASDVQEACFRLLILALSLVLVQEKKNAQRRIIVLFLLYSFFAYEEHLCYHTKAIINFI